MQGMALESRPLRARAATTGSAPQVRPEGVRAGHVAAAGDPGPRAGPGQVSGPAPNAGQLGHLSPRRSRDQMPRSHATGLCRLIRSRRPRSHFLCREFGHLGSR